jgi:MFS family permease
MKKHTKVLLLVATGVFMSTLDSSMLNVALPSIMKSFDSTLALTEWVILIYLLTITVMLLFWGHLSKKYGQERIYSSGALIFSIGSLLCFLGSDIYLLIFFRFTQAMGASMMMAMGPALIKSVYAKENLGRGLGQIGIATSLGLMSGPAISGILIRWTHWRFIFLITVPIGMLVYFFGRRNLLISPQVDSQSPVTNNGQPFDTTGALLWVCAVCTTLVVTSYATTYCCSTGSSSHLFLMTTGLTLALWTMLIIN